MRIYDELAARMINDLQNGWYVPVKNHDGNWSKQEVPYEVLLKGQCTNVVMRKVWLHKFYQLSPIPRNEKEEWKKFVREVFPERTKRFLVEATRILYTIGNLQEKNTVAADVGKLT
jgi:hypothetical protein